MCNVEDFIDKNVKNEKIQTMSTFRWHSDRANIDDLKQAKKRGITKHFFPVVDIRGQTAPWTLNFIQSMVLTQVS